MPSLCAGNVLKHTPVFQFHNLIVLSRLPVMSFVSSNCKHRMPLVCPFNVLNSCPEFTSHTLAVESYEPVIRTLSSNCRHITPLVWPLNTLVVNRPCFQFVP